VNAELARTPLFEGLTPAALEELSGQLRPRRFGARELICRAGEPGDSLLVIRSGLAHVYLEQPDGGLPVARLRRGDVVGEMSLLTGEPRSASVLAAVPTEVLELSQEAFAGILARYPAVLVNLSRILSRRLARTTLQSQERQRGEAVALVAGGPTSALAGAVVEATRAASPRGVALLDLTGSLPVERIPLEERRVESALALLDDLLASHGTVIVAVDASQENLPFLLEHMDRILLIARDDEPWLRAPDAAARSAEVALATEDPRRAPRTVNGLPVVCAVDAANPGRGAAWLGRHLSRTKLGLALGAGGAKGYAHVGALHVLEAAGYAVDYVGGSSIGGMVGSWMALGMGAAAAEATMRGAFTPESVEKMFKLSFSGLSTGLEEHTRVCRETTRDLSFADLQFPLVVMAVDLNTRQPAPITDGPIWEALLATTALPGMFPPVTRGDQRLVDGLALVPVPADAVRGAGADVTVSVNIMSREILPAWPGQAPPEKPPAERGSRMLDTLLEVMDLAQLDSSVRHAARADVVITPRFGPGSWRDFHLADLFLTAGRQAAEEQLASLRALARPQSSALSA
jgi:NTE family protein